jgi:hypothetical protein
MIATLLGNEEKTLDPDRRLLFTGQETAEAAPVAPAEKAPGITGGEVCVDGMGKPKPLPRGDVSTQAPPV